MQYHNMPCGAREASPNPLWWFGSHVYDADGRPVTSPLTGVAMGTSLKPNLIVRSMGRNLLRTGPQEA